MKVREAMTSPVLTVEPGATLKEAATLLARNRISALPVVDGGAVVGVVSEADLIAVEAAADPRLRIIQVAEPEARRVADVMTSPAVTVEAEADLGLAAERMLEAGVKRLPVVDGGRLVGILARHDLIKLLAGSDDRVRSLVAAALAAEGLGAVEVSVEEGVVGLGGDVDEGELRLAEMLARTVPGVLGVRRPEPSLNEHP